MSFTQSFRLALKSLLTSKMRSLLTMLASSSAWPPSSSSSPWGTA